MGVVPVEEVVAMVTSSREELSTHEVHRGAAQSDGLFCTGTLSPTSPALPDVTSVTRGYDRSQNRVETWCILSQPLTLYQHRLRRGCVGLAQPVSWGLSGLGELIGGLRVETVDGPVNGRASG